MATKFASSEKDLEKVDFETSDVAVSDVRQDEHEVDGVFGELAENAPNYKNVGWIRAAVLLMKAQIGLGVLGLPAVFSTVGLVPGILIITLIAAMTSWSSLVVGSFKLRHPHVHSIADVGMLWWGPFGREFLGAIYWLYMICISGAGMVGVSIALNTLSEHGACTVVFVVVAAITIGLISSIRTLDKISWLGWVGMISIMSAVLTLAVAVGVQDRPSLAPAAPAPWDKNIQIFGSPTFAEAGSALGTVVFAFAGTPAFFTVVAEMRNARDFNKTVYLCQSFVTITYLVIGVVVYAFCGDYVDSPALGSAGPLLKKVCYGLALPALVIGAMIYTHLPAKYIFVRCLRGSKHLASNSIVHWTTWLGSVAFSTLIAFLIAEAIPVFGGLIGLVGALFGTVMSMQVMGGMWLYDNVWRPLEHTIGQPKSFLHKITKYWAFFLIIGGTFATIAGTYGAIDYIVTAYVGTDLVVFSCADNS